MITIKLSRTNCYVLETKVGYLLVDTGYETDKELFYKKLKKNHLDIAEIKYLYLTHHHDDHAGLLDELTDKNPDIQVVINQQCLELLKAGKNTLK